MEALAEGEKWEVVRLAGDILALRLFCKYGKIMVNLGGPINDIGDDLLYLYEDLKTYEESKEVVVRGV